MAKRGKSRGQKDGLQSKQEAARSDSTSEPTPHRDSADRTKPPISRRKLWAFRLTAAVGMPLLLFLVVELCLRIAGFGYPTRFLLEREQNDKPVYTENDRFGWRFFGPRLARSPQPFSMAVDKPDETTRIFVFGESAAYGDPQPEYGLPRMLEAMLSLRHPQRRFEVINAAMTGINSHAVRAIAADCVAAEGDIWVLYMGNNEVVGPFGAGTVFGRQSPPLPLVRAALGLKTTATGQLLERILPAASPSDAKNWGGMMMFVKNQVRRDDPRMERVYDHFKSNLNDILELGRRNKIGVVVSTVAVNLKDCAPFASATDSGLAAEKKAEWDSLYQQANAALDARNAAEAAEIYEKAAKIDNASAELHFRLGHALLASADLVHAREHLQLAADLDLLRFRCDSRLNAIIRESAAGREGDGIRFVDAAERLHEQSSQSISGSTFFYEHVHLTFAGTYQLARALAEQVEALLPKPSGAESSATVAWPTVDQCADRLAWSDLSLESSLADVLVRLSEPPFTSQLNHTQQIKDVAERLYRVRASIDPTATKAAAEQCRKATEAAPDDHVLKSRLAYLLGQSGDLDGSYQAALEAAELLPHNVTKWSQIGLVSAMQKRDKEAIEAFEKGLALNPNEVFVRLELARALIRLDRKQEALDELQRAVEINPSFGPGYLNIGLIQDERGETKVADANFRLAAKHRVNRLADLTAIARLCQSKGWYEDAAACYRDALRVNPSGAALHLNLAQCLDGMGKHEEAERHFKQGVALAPQFAQGRYLFGVHLAKREMHALAAEQFEAAAESDPEFLTARVDCAMALIALDRLKEALAHFNKVLQRDPKHAVALEYKAAIEKELGQQPNR